MQQKKLYRVKLSFFHDWPLMRQTPNWSAVWGEYYFFIDDNEQDCDFWIIFSKYKLKPQTCICPPENVILITWEPFAVEQFSKAFVKQFGKVITCQREITHHNVSYDLCGQPWFVNKSYDELLAMEPVKKNKSISLITSNKTETQGHKRRLEFAYKLKAHFGNDLDLYGRGINDFNDKWDVLAPYKYSITIENNYYKDYLTEKFFDCHLAYTYPIYYGCPNAAKYFSDRSFSAIDINNFEQSVKTIEQILSTTNHYERHLPIISEERLKVLNKYNFFPLVASYMTQMNGNAPHVQKTLKLESFIFRCIWYLKRRIG